MKYKNQKLLFLLSQNCREGLKNLGSELRQSPQTTSYQIHKLEEDKHISYCAIVDHIRLGYSSLLVGFNLRNYTKENRQKAIKALKKAEHVVSLNLARNGYDFIVEMKARNLSHFNKIHTEFMLHHSDILVTKFVSPIIVKHSYPRNYLIKKNIKQDIITLGDREILHLSDEEHTVLNILEDKPRMTLVEMSTKTKLGIKKITNIKKNLEKQKIIRKYTCFFDYEKVGIRKQIIMLRVEDQTHQSSQKITEFAKQNAHCVDLLKVVGFYNIFLVVEFIETTNILEDIRELFAIDDHLVVNITKQY